ncbi:hypothetical protein L6654_42520 [Bradyrhizobium sp. WYCCWR 13023]|uniref:Uncharacterized protein n=1 Tax=Bradyrhizobium zhengyangense TaxID=2911009 RepID=A0A9X1RKS4_9BRAD|nr:hypothetical protein [Bradyrhizobium zhengyangense]MCG2633192.1 hypothetical protein [Bradyrhizobium zhengyangense]
MLLKKGDSWNGGMNGPSSGAWNRTGGRSAAEPMLISSYGTGARPLFKTNGIDTSCYSTTATRGQYMALVGIECYNDAIDPASPTYLGTTVRADISAASPTLTNMASTAGILPGYVAYGSGINGLVVQSVTSNSVTLNGNPQFTSSQIPIQFNKRLTQSSFALTGTTNFLIVEDCKLNFGSLAISNMITATTAPIVGLNLRIRRNLFLDAYVLGYGGNGMFLSDNQLAGGQVLIEENLVDHAGWNSSLWGVGANVFSHNFYLHDNNPSISFLRNITANAAATGAQVRNGGTIYDNLSIRNPIAFLTDPGIQFNSTTYSYNVITEGSDIVVGVRSATAATTSGNKVLNLDGILTAGNYNFMNQMIADLDNPGALSGSVVSFTATTVTMSGAVAAGKRGDGVRAGDRLVVYMPRVQGIVLGSSGNFAPTVNSGGSSVYPIGSTVFYFPAGYTLPSWVVPGMNIAVASKANDFAGGQTTIASISADRTQLTTAAPTTGAVVGGSAATGGEQDKFIIWQSIPDTLHPTQTVGPNNIFTTSSGYYKPSFAYSPQAFTRSINATGNYYYNWNTVTSQNVIDYGLSGSNTNSPSKLNVAGSTSYPNATVEAYDKSIGGPGTVEHFLTQARLQSKDNWDSRYTAQAANNFIRNAVGCNCSQ